MIMPDCCTLYGQPAASEAAGVVVTNGIQRTYAWTAHAAEYLEVGTTGQKYQRSSGH